MDSPQWLRRLLILTPRTAAALYLALGMAWVLAGDWLLAALVSDAHWHARIEIWKGWAYVALTAVLAGWLVHRLRATERKRLERDEEFSQVVRYASAGIARVRVDGQVLWANPRLLDMLNVGESDLPKLNLRSFVQSPHTAEVAEQLKRLLAGDIDHYVGERQCLRAGGLAPLPVLCTITAIRDGDDKSGDSMICALQDVSGTVQARAALERSEARLRLALEASASGVWDWDVRAQAFSFSPGIARMLAYRGIDLASEPKLMERVVPADRERVRAAVHGTLETGEVLIETFGVQCFDGQLRWFQARGQWYAAEHGEPERVTGLLTDLSDARFAEERQRLAMAVVDNAAQGVVVTDTQGSIRLVNAAALRILGYTEAEVVGRNPRMFQSGRHDRAFYQALWEQVVQSGHWQGELWNKRKNGEIFPEQAAISAVSDAGGTVTHYICMFTDQSQSKAREQQIEYLAGHDALTGLVNRDTLVVELDAICEQAAVSDERFAVLQLNLDRFKEVNESYGHTVGDAVLRHIAQQVQQALRPGDLIARLAGDELAVVARNLRPADGAAAVARNLMQAAGKPWHTPEGFDVVVRASVGICMYPDDMTSTEGLLQGAHSAVYGAKALGRGAWCFYNESMTQDARERLSLEARLRRALAEGELRLYYQPQVDIASGRIAGAEALLRWQDPDEGLISPARFIPVAESSGLIAPIGQWVLKEACRQAQQWRTAGMPALTMAVNVSPRQFSLGDLVADVGQALSQSGFPANFLELEITEGTMADRPEQALALLNQLADMGLRLTVDDFGTGYSSLAHIKRFPIDALKIDQSFVRDIPESADDMAICSAIIAMGQSMGFDVLAEGVETQDQLDFLRARGCDSYQGYLRSRPVPAEAFEALLRE